MPKGTSNRHSDCFSSVTELVSSRVDGVSSPNVNPGKEAMDRKSGFAADFLDSRKMNVDHQVTSRAERLEHLRNLKREKHTEVNTQLEEPSTIELKQINDGELEHTSDVDEELDDEAKNNSATADLKRDLQKEFQLLEAQTNNAITRMVRFRLGKASQS